jgi:tryptophanyl-tRNA synthetase
VTDSGRDVRSDDAEKPGISNLLTIYSVLAGVPIPELEERYAGRGYGDFKSDLAELVVEFVTPFRDRTLELLGDRVELDKILATGAERAQAVAGDTLATAYDRIGFVRGTTG